jgi:hypothetical protein
VRRALRNGLVAVVAFVLLAFALDAIVGVAQPAFEPAEEGALRTFDPDGAPHESRLVVVDDGATLWLHSGHHFRGWYERLLRNPDVELARAGGAFAPYRAVPIDTPESEARITELMKQRTGALPFYMIRTLLLFADVKPVRLDPR